jgi:hypothetical protein
VKVKRGCVEIRWKRNAQSIAQNIDTICIQRRQEFFRFCMQMRMFVAILQSVSALSAGFQCMRPFFVEHVSGGTLLG